MAKRYCLAIKSTMLEKEGERKGEKRGVQIKITSQGLNSHKTPLGWLRGLLQSLHPTSEGSQTDKPLGRGSQLTRPCGQSGRNACPHTLCPHLQGGMSEEGLMLPPLAARSGGAGRTPKSQPSLNTQSWLGLPLCGADAPLAGHTCQAAAGAIVWPFSPTAMATIFPSLGSSLSIATMWSNAQRGQRGELLRCQAGPSQTL